MRSKWLSLVLLLGMFLPSLVRGAADLLDQIKTRQLPQTALQEHVLSLNESGVVELANEAFAKGWDPYAVGQGIIRPYYESKGIVFTTEKKLTILKDPKMHPHFRAEVAVWGIRDPSLDIDAFLEYSDEVLTFFEDDTLDYFYKQGVPGLLREALQRKSADVRKEPGDERHKSQALDQLHARGIRLMSDLVSYLEKNPQPSKDREGYCASCFAVASLSKYIAWYFSEEAPRAREAAGLLDAVRRAQRVLVWVLENAEYDSEAAHMVLRCAVESRLGQVLAKDAVTRLKKDNRFSGEEAQRQLDGLRQSIDTGRSK